MFDRKIREVLTRVPTPIRFPCTCLGDTRPQRRVTPTHESHLRVPQETGYPLGVTWQVLLLSVRLRTGESDGCESGDRKSTSPGEIQKKGIPGRVLPKSDQRNVPGCTGSTFWECRNRVTTTLRLNEDHGNKRRNVNWLTSRLVVSNGDPLSLWVSEVYIKRLKICNNRYTYPGRSQHVTCWTCR